MNCHELWRILLHALIANAHEILRVTSVEFLACDKVPELRVLFSNLVLDVERAQQDVDAHVVRSKTEFKLEPFEDSVCEEEIRLDRIDV